MSFRLRNIVTLLVNPTVRQKIEAVGDFYCGYNRPVGKKNHYSNHQISNTDEKNYRYTPSLIQEPSISSDVARGETKDGNQKDTPCWI